ncbi:hypothetical protein [Vibrio lentus]|uniref:hypothetical protein n=1 Tax=Vibrio lentus TaxID=136468 RepID=UPI000C86024D|nr:hypothetical protein [Vibrio lentus]PMI79178.1 hypothetical protein BCU36_20095 [Vibrio lentus]PMI88149.1 hypothetical protein BCU35_10620 [Vibrio lentus]
MKLSKKSSLTLIINSLLLASTSAMASSGCFSGETDGSQWLESVIEPQNPILIHYNSDAWDDIEKFQFDFGYDKIDNPRSLSVRVQLAERTTEKMSISGRIKGANWANGGSNRGGRIDLYMNLNSEGYFSLLGGGELNLGLGRTGSNETLEIVKVTAKFCGLPVESGVSVDASTHNLLSHSGEPLSHYIDADTTYRISATANAKDGNGNAITSVSVNYTDPRNAENTTLQLNTTDELYVHTDGKVSLYYAAGSNQNSGSHTVKFERVNLD